MGKGASGDHQPATIRSPHPGGTVRDAVIAGHRGDHETASRLVGHQDPAVRTAALGALHRLGALETETLVAALADPETEVRRRACVLAGRLLAAPGTNHELVDAVVRVLESDPRSTVVETAAWSLGEAGSTCGRSGVQSLERVATAHVDPLCRESAVAALGAIGDPGALDCVLAALGDKPAVRRRAAIALSAFDDPRVEVALRRCLEDRDWQVRQAAEDLLGRG